MAFASVASLVILAACVTLAHGWFTPDIANVANYSLYRVSGNSSLYQLITPDAVYTTPVYLIDLHGTRYEQGFAYGAMLASAIYDVYWSLLDSILGSKLIDKELANLIGEALDWQWDDYLSVQLPIEFKQEIQGIDAGGESVGHTGLGKLVTRAITLANAPGDIGDFVLILLREFKPSIANLLPKPKGGPIRGMCSMFAAWGSRTQGKKLYSGRNLDWSKNTGINKYKIIHIHHPPGKIAHATFGFAGLWGALTGISAAGMTVHEANLEENEITFGGFPWILRLRYIMENAKTSQDVRALWAATNNTVGFNHMVASGPDAASYARGGYSGPGVATAMETMFNYTAYFTANDPREAAALYNGSHIGFPMPEALWRTNHGYDPTIRQHYEWSQSPDSWSMERYVFIHDALVTYQSAGVAISMLQAVNITAVAGDKGQHPYDCEANTDGTNVLSVAYDASDIVALAAWESNSGQDWRPACCSTYLAIDLNEWFSS